MTAIATPLTPDRTLGDVIVVAPPRMDTSPRTLAMLSGGLLLATILGGVYAQAFLSDRLIITGDAGATARNFVAHPSVVRAAFAIFMVEMACQVGTTAAMYELLKPVNGSLSRAAAAFGYIGSGIKILARLFFYAPLLVLGGTSALSAFNQGQLDAIAYLLIRINGEGAGMACIFLGANTVIVGYLMLRSGFLPRVLGVLGIVGGAGWLSFVYPPLASMIFMPVALFALVSCAVTIWWLMVRGVDEKKWYEMAAGPGRFRTEPLEPRH
jgi:Domain of unknown function (DUF4386)